MEEIREVKKMELSELTEKIIGCAYEVSNALGSGFPENVYEKALLVGEFFADLLIGEKVLVEIKAVRALDELHVAQAMNYLKASGMPVCLLMNFGRPKIEIRRFVPYDVWKETKPSFTHHRMR